jgi:hypothetical protein
MHNAQPVALCPYRPNYRDSRCAMPEAWVEPRDPRSWLAELERQLGYKAGCYGPQLVRVAAGNTSITLRLISSGPTRAGRELLVLTAWEMVVGRPELKTAYVPHPRMQRKPGGRI